MLVVMGHIAFTMSVCMYVCMYVCGLVRGFFYNIYTCGEQKPIFTNSVKLKFAHIASILRHLESKCFIHLKSLILSHLELLFHI